MFFKIPRLVLPEAKEEFLILENILNTKVQALYPVKKERRKFIYLSIENIIIENKNKIIHTQKGQKMS